MADPLAEVVSLLQLAPRYAKVVDAAGAWRVQRTETGQASFCVILDGSCRLTVGDSDPLLLSPGDFVLIPATYEFGMSSLVPPPHRHAVMLPVQLGPGEFRLGEQHGPPEVRYIVGYCEFGSPDAALLVSLLPKFIHVCGERRLATLAELLREESLARRPAREVIMTRLLEVLLIEALRSAQGTMASPGLLRGLADARLAVALRLIHATPARAWTVAALAQEAALSRSGFFERFNQAVGVAPMEYVLTWRMALAKDLLRRGDCRIAQVAEQVGYSSASTFNVAFTRHAGITPARYARQAGLATAPARSVSSHPVETLAHQYPSSHRHAHVVE
ncbi:AraC family transcriptional regulator [Pseudoduganella sp. SL102]|uniref:AraC family transcriptional regulator n=1 Tax=Pseudoduganella sp. SL102 TaxID=2995154 RepID=UPI00248CD8C5|nr:AraC family transcriptional regulator [Pseudoduganella sp. SL102]WBS05114.1 AraC family transcriptional regulator [Pseudoduganella sp. SL102]